MPVNLNGVLAKIKPFVVIYSHSWFQVHPMTTNDAQLMTINDFNYNDYFRIDGCFIFSALMEALIAFEMVSQYFR